MRKSRGDRGRIVREGSNTHDGADETCAANSGFGRSKKGGMSLSSEVNRLGDGRPTHRPAPLLFDAFPRHALCNLLQHVVNQNARTSKHRLAVTYLRIHHHVLSKTLSQLITTFPLIFYSTRYSNFPSAVTPTCALVTGLPSAMWLKNSLAISGSKVPVRM